ncbi:hypothetical protein DICPUDRAFT_83841 [Dictyostelium purpureum]|uniref:Uncharacterized protein n=1 Tax=Dictyostelium purpureum TaxID=5786 RepID=F1A0T0_DICPU|nr:uncharacterized protein DICPUDRAFT_83841 [Dictyostelium purpureum]EGC30204.1 hypothetical protein DICPUDRAFT_83841 [Dictyostelium purpureum]|eukprot:XP_003293267.1 hypothetical protein DICPUDRAFT_83841 [Dictyostelium purpureum]
MNKNKIKLKINILPKLILSVVLLGLLATFITIEPVKVLELTTKTYKSKYLKNYGEIKESRKYQTNRYEFSFEYVDILDLSHQNENGTININRIHYEENSSLYSFFNRFSIYYKIYLTFIVMLFISVLVSFFFPYSNNIFKDSITRRFRKIVLFTSFFLFYIPLFVTMILLLSLDFKNAVLQDSKENTKLNKICFNKDGEPFGFCKSLGLSDYRNHLTLDQLNQETIINNSTMNGWAMFITFGFLIYIVFYNTIKGHKFKKNKENEPPSLNEMIDLQISKNSLGEPSSSKKSFENQSLDSLENTSSSTQSMSPLNNSNSSSINNSNSKITTNKD